MLRVEGSGPLRQKLPSFGVLDYGRIQRMNDSLRAQAGIRDFGVCRVTLRRPWRRSEPTWILVIGLCAASCSTPTEEETTPAPATNGGTAAAVSAAVVPEQAPPSEPAPVVPVQATPEVPSVYVKSRFVWVRPDPSTAKDWIGFLWTGARVPLKSTEPIAGPGCKTYYAIEPQGYVCVDDKRATLDPKDPVYLAIAPYAPKVDSPWLHQYGESIGLPRYFKTPTPEHQRQREIDLTSHLRDLSAAREGQTPKRLASVDLSLPSNTGFDFPELPRTIFDDRRYLKPRSTIAFSTEARFADRGFLLTADYTWVPKDRVKPFPKVEYRGIRLGKDAKLPLALFRKKDRPKYEKTAEGGFEASGETFTRLTFVELTGKTERWEKNRYFETRQDGVWVRELDAAIPDPRSKTPWGAPIDQEDTTGRAPKGGRGTWLEISINNGWLLAFEGTKAVYATLMSPGRGGAALPDTDPLETSATPTGVYPISGKLITATMVAPGELVHSDVPFAQNIVGPYALHGAYWHDNWGNPQSGGCINLSPFDAKWMFDFTEPAVPEGWHAVRWLPWQGPATIVILHR